MNIDFFVKRTTVGVRLKPKNQPRAASMCELVYSALPLMTSTESNYLPKDYFSDELRWSRFCKTSRRG